MPIPAFVKPVQENIELMREDGGTIVFKPVKGDYTGRLNYVTFREDFDPVTGDRLIEKSSIAGQVRCTYNATRKESTFEFDYVPDDTRDRPQSQLVYDITSISASDATDVKTPKSGYCKILGDVRNDLNNTNLPEDGERYIPILASLFDDEEIVKVKIVNGVKTYTGTGLYDGAFQYDSNGDLMPVENPVSGINFSVDNNGDLMPS